MKPTHPEIHLAPVDKTAAMVFAGGVRHEYKGKFQCAHWDAPPPLKDVPRNAQNLIGTRQGRLTVIGYYDSSADGAKWAVRCDCGQYEVRKSKSMTNPNNFGDRCQKCRDAAFIRKDYAFRKTGEILDQRKL